MGGVNDPGNYEIRGRRGILFSMHTRIFGREVHISFWKTIGILLFISFIGGATLFGYRVYGYFRAIQQGDANPYLSEKLQSSVSHAVANTNVTSEDLALIQDTSSPALGSDTPTLTIVEFLDYGCPFCRASFEPVRELTQKYGDKVRLIVRNFPLEDLHPGANRAAYAALCAQDQNKFWVYHDKLFVNQGVFEETDLLQYAKEAGLDVGVFQSCLDTQKFRNRIESDVTVALRAGVQGTPTFFFNGARIQGALDQKTLEYLIQAFLKQELK